MKKTFKRAGVAVLSMAMLLSMGAVGLTANAAEGGSAATKDQTTLTVNTNANLTTGKYKVYKVATLNNLGVWTWAAELGVTDSAIKNTSTGVSFDINTGKFWNGASTYSADGTAEQKKALAAYLAQNLGSLTAINTSGTDLGNSIELSTDGTTNQHAYYLILVESSNAGIVVNPILQEINTSTADSTNGTVISVKSSKLPFDKAITSINNDGSVSDSGNTGVAEIGSTVTYTIKAQLPTYDSKVTSSTASLQDFVITDTPTEGITIEPETVSVYLSEDETLNTSSDTPWTLTDYTKGTVSAVAGVNSAGFTITPTKANLINNRGKYLFVRFNATVNSSAKFGAANPNTATLSYGNDYSTGGGSGSATDVVNVFTAQLLINKINSSSTVLPGAKFKLYKANSSYNKGAQFGSEFTTDAAGQIIIQGLDEGYYVLEETHAPTGYVAVSDIHIHITNTQNASEYTAVFSDGGSEFTWNASATNKSATPSDASDDTKIAALTKDVTDPPLGALPGTGGMGTTLFTVGGAVIVLMAGFMFVLYMRKRKTEE